MILVQILLMWGLVTETRKASAFLTSSACQNRCLGSQFPSKRHGSHVLSRVRMQPGRKWYFRLSAVSDFSEEENQNKSSRVIDTATSKDPRVAEAEKQAEELRHRAKKLMAEANAEEAALRESRSKLQKERLSESDAMIAHLFTGNATSTLIADRIRRERWSKEQLVLVMERLHERQTLALGLSSSIVKGDFQIGDMRNNAVPNATEYKLVDEYIQSLVEAASTLDEDYEDKKHNVENIRWTGRVGPALKTRLKELRRVNEEGFKRRLAAQLSAAVRNSEDASSDSMVGYMRRTLGQPEPSPEKNITRILEKVALIPMWVPTSILPFVVSAKARLESDDVKTIQSDLLMGTEFYCTDHDSIPLAAVFRGNIRTASGLVNSTTDQNQTAVVFEKIQARLAQTGLDERVQLFFLKDPEWRPGRDSREPEAKPVILALPKAVVPEQPKERSMATKILAGSSVLLTLVATFAYSVACYSLNPNFFEAVVNQNDYNVLRMCIPVFLGVLALQTIHEVAHYLVAKQSRIKIGLPVPVPSLQLGTFGSITPFRSFPPNRPALLDFALSGPMAQMIMSLFLMIAGVLGTIYASTVAISNFPVVPVALFRSSFLTGTMLTALAPKLMMLPLSQPIPIHPLFVTGFAGLISSALNLLPVGRLDGGRACTAVFGSRFNVIMSFLTLLLLSLLALTGSSVISIFWGAFIVLFQRQPEIPVRNEVTDVDDMRVGAYTVSLALALLALAPVPGGPGFL